jgi:hypothetical protein
MPLTHILVDFENTQPSAADVALLRDAQQHLWIFRGPSQKKYDAEFAEALLVLGERLHIVKCAKSGRNALDMHIAFQMGRLLGESTPPEGALPAFTFVIVSRDTDYEPLLQYMRSLGCPATRVPSVREALGAAPAEKAGVARAARAKSAATAPRAGAAGAAQQSKRTPAAKAKPAKKTPAAKAAKAATKSAGARAAAKTAPPAPAAESPLPVEELVDKVAEHLRDRPRNRPTRLDKLQSWLQSHLRSKLAGADVPDIVERLERRGLVRFAGNKVEYPMWT